MNPKSYLEAYKKEVLERTERWSIKSNNESNIEYAQKKLETSLNILDRSKMEFESKEDEAEFNSYVNGDRDFKSIIMLLEKSLMQDIKDCTNNQYPNIFDSVALGIFPFGHSYAYCSNMTHNRDELDGHIIVINEGLYIALELLAKSIVVENLQNDLESFKHSGAESFRYAINMYLNPDPSLGAKILFKGLPAEVYGEISAYQSSVAMMVLKFISLHEFGHAVNNDCDVMNIHQIFMSSNKKSINSVLFHNTEYNADLFAMKAININTSTNKSAWANFTTIYLFFYWLYYVEKHSKKTESSTHPEPLDRAEKLYLYMIECYGFDEESELGLTWVRDKTKEWYKMSFGETNEN